MIPSKMNTYGAPFHTQIPEGQVKGRAVYLKEPFVKSLLRFISKKIGCPESFQKLNCHANSFWLPHWKCKTKWMVGVRCAHWSVTLENYPRSTCPADLGANSDPMCGIPITTLRPHRLACHRNRNWKVAQIWFFSPLNRNFKKKTLQRHMDPPAEGFIKFS